MSLINQMLKDLAQRSKPHPSPEMILSGLVNTDIALPKKNKPYLFMMIGFFILFIMVMTYLQLHQIKKVIAHPVTINKIVLPITKKPIPKFLELSTEPALLTAITQEVQNNITSLHFFLNRNALYRITGNGSDRFLLVLENTKLNANIPQVETPDSAIKIIRTTSLADGSLKILLGFKNGAILNNLELHKVGNHSELQINLTYKNNSETGFVFNNTAPNIKKMSYDTSVEEEYQKAMNFSAQGNDTEAIAQLSTFLEKFPTYVAARKSLVTLLLKEHNLPQAQRLIEKGLQLQPFFPPYIQLKAQLLVDEGKIKQALNLLQKAPPAMDEFPDYHALMAALYQRDNNFLLAEKLYEQLLNLQPNNSIWWLGLAIAYDSLNKTKEALDAYAKANSTGNLSAELKVYVETRVNALS